MTNFRFKKIFDEIAREYPQKTMNHAELYRFWINRHDRLVGLYFACSNNQAKLLQQSMRKARKNIEKYLDILNFEIQQMVEEKYGKTSLAGGLWKESDVYVHVYLKDDEPSWIPRKLD